MKTILLSIAIFLSLSTFGQSPNDSAYIKNIPLQARVIFYVVHRTTDPANDSLYTVFLKWRTSLRNNPVSGTTTVTIDTIPTVELANLYNYVLNQPDGFSVGTIMKLQLNSARTANPYFDRLCAATENSYAGQLQSILANGRKLLLGK